MDSTNVTALNPLSGVDGRCIRVSVTGGVVEGVTDGKVQRFLSLPYAAPVTDARRFEAPFPVEPWPGVRDATRAGASAPQVLRKPLKIDMDALVFSSDAPGPDYLTLNVWAPAAQTAPRPVMVFIHGGSFSAGSKDAPVYDGAAFARDGVVLVSINYRLGILGFLPIPGVATNLGLRDAVAALEWVRDNIASFGGDPGNVTLFGESAGAACAEILALSPLTKALIKRVIVQSGHALLSRDVTTMQSVVRRLGKKLGVSCDKSGFDSVSTARLLKAQDWVSKAVFGMNMRDAHGVDVTFGGSRFIPVHGDDLAPFPDLEALGAGAGGDVDMLIGANTEEANLFFAAAGARMQAWQVRLATSRATPRSRELLRAYGLDRRGANADKVMSQVMTDFFFRAPARRIASLHRGNTWFYEFEWRSPACDGELGAAHAVELPFVFDTLAAATGPRGVAGDNPPAELARSIHALWIGFAANGTLPWPQYRQDTRMVYALAAHGAAPDTPIAAAAYLSPFAVA